MPRESAERGSWRLPAAAAAAAHGWGGPAGQPRAEHGRLVGVIRTTPAEFLGCASQRSHQKSLCGQVRLEHFEARGAWEAALRYAEARTPTAPPIPF